MQHILNSLRPFEAREELIAEARAQVDAKRRLLAELRDACVTREGLQEAPPTEHAVDPADNAAHASGPGGDAELQGQGGLAQAQAFLQRFADGHS